MITTTCCNDYHHHKHYLRTVLSAVSLSLATVQPTSKAPQNAKLERQVRPPESAKQKWNTGIGREAQGRTEEYKKATAKYIPGIYIEQEGRGSTPSKSSLIFAGRRCRPG